MHKLLKFGDVRGLAGLVSALNLAASTPVAGFALVNGTPNILSWQAPNDGQLHDVLVMTSETANGAATGGAVGLTLTAPDGTVGTPQIYGGTPGAGFHNASFVTYVIQAGSTFQVNQTSALTAGVCTLWARLWAS